MLKIDGQIILS